MFEFYVKLKCTNFQKIWKQHQNSRGLKRDEQQVPHRGPIGYYAST